MKLLLIVIPVVVLLIFIACSNRTDVDVMISGNMNDIEENIDLLMKSDNEQAFLIIHVSDNANFIQFTPFKNGVQLDFPLITQRQKEKESHFKKIAKEFKLKVIENEGSDGARFLDIDINGTATEISNIVRPFLKKLYGVNESSKLKFEQNF